MYMVRLGLDERGEQQRDYRRTQQKLPACLAQSATALLS